VNENGARRGREPRLGHRQHAYGHADRSGERRDSLAVHQRRTTWGAWRIDAASGQLFQDQTVDYEALTTTTTYEYQWNGYEYQEYAVTTRDPSLAIANIGVQAIDDSTGQVATANLQLTVGDVNEAASIAPSTIYRSGGGGVIQNSSTNFYVRSDRGNGTIVSLNAYDPEGQALNYWISDQATRDINVTYGGNDEIDGGYPYLSINSAGQIGFTVYGDPDWEGGTKINSQRRTLSIEYTFNVNISDSSGMTTVIPYSITFLRRNQMVPPVVLDLDGDGVELVSFQGSGVSFDMDMDGVTDPPAGSAPTTACSRSTATTTASSTISRKFRLPAICLAPCRTSRASGLRHGRQRQARCRGRPLRRLQGLARCHQDGVSQAHELRSLAGAGVVSIDLALQRTGAKLGGSDNVVYATAGWTDAAGATHTVADVFFAYDPSNLDTIAAPIVLDYDGDGSGLVSVRDSKARFDMDGDGTADRTGWIAKGDALLVLDRNRDGTINDLSEISFTADKLGAETDLEGLAAFDSDGDGDFSALDARFGEFQLWFDRNGDGKSDAGELQTLAEAGIHSIALGGVKAPGGSESMGSNLVFARSSFKRADGTTGSVLDAGLAYLPGGGDSTIAFSGWDGGALSEVPPATKPAAAPLAATPEAHSGGNTTITKDDNMIPEAVPNPENRAGDAALRFTAEAPDVRPGNAMRRLTWARQASQAGPSSNLDRAASRARSADTRSPPRAAGCSSAATSQKARSTAESSRSRRPPCWPSATARSAWSPR
jgi:hypothetical protein